MTRRNGYHGLPAEYRSEREDWQTTIRYLEALQQSNRPIVVAVVDEDSKRMREFLLTQQIGFLRRLPDREGEPDLVGFALNWPDPEQPCGQFTMDGQVFKNATLSTVDGDDYFWLTLDFGSHRVRLTDANSNMNHAQSEWSKRNERSYLDLPTAKEIEEGWAEEHDSEVIATIKTELRELRSRLIRSGATDAKNLTEAELAAMAVRIRWRQLRSQQTPAAEDEPTDPWVRELARTFPNDS